MKSQDQIHVWSLLSKAADYRAFMRSYVAWMKSQKSGYGYASLARKAGFAARSYPRDVINGSRNLTAGSIPRFVEAMGLTGEAARYFHLLVYKERPDVAELLKFSRAKLSKQVENRGRPNARVFNWGSWPLIYAGLGDPSRGATAEEVSLRCRLSLQTCRDVLAQMVNAGLAVQDGKSQRYFSRNPHLVCTELGGDEGFKNFFLSSLRRAESQARKNFKKTDRLFFSSAISIRRSDLRRCRHQLRELLNSFAESSEHPSGDDVVTIVCGLFPQGD